MNTPSSSSKHANSKYVIAIDVGNSGTKVGLVSLDGNVLVYVNGRYETIFLPNGGAEQNPLNWWHVVSSGIQQVIKQSGVSPSDIIAIGTTSMWAVTVAVDDIGNPLMNAISWMDTRGGKYNAALVKGFPSIQGYGLVKLLKWITISVSPPFLDGNDSLAHMLFIKNELPDIYQKTYKFLEPMDFINMRLTGKACATRNSNTASLLIDSRQKGTSDYATWAIQQTGIDRSKLPDLLPVEGIVGNLDSKIAQEWGLSPDTIVITSATDNSVAPIGTGAIADYEAVAVLGTSGMLVFHCPNKNIDLFHMLGAMPGALKDRNIIFGDTGNTGRVIDSFLMNLVFGQDGFTTSESPVDIYNLLNHSAEKIPPGSDGVLFLPWFNSGSLAPTADRFLQGGFINLTNSTTRDHLARALLEGITFNWRWLKEAAEDFARRKFQFWRLTGGGANSDVWAQIMADVLQIPMHQMENPSSNTMLGIAFLAFNRLGLMSLDEIPNKVRIKRIFVPNPANKEIYDFMYTQFRKCARQLKPIFHSINKNS